MKEKAVLISIRPEWCEVIANKRKTLEVRKTRPKIATPFKCFIYETKGKTATFIDEDCLFLRRHGHEIYEGRGQVIGEFTCDNIIKAECGNYVSLPTSKTLINAFDLMDYANDKTVYGWHISNLIIYDKPKELSDFICRKPLSRPPQSWCYVNE